MKLSISNIAWANEEEKEVARLLRSLGVENIEIAPTKLWHDPTVAPQKQIDDYIGFWMRHDLKIIAFQSMLYTRPGMMIFDDQNNRQKTSDYLKRFIDLAGKMGVQALVFGSPKNRQRKDLPVKQADNIAIDFFKQLGDRAIENNTVFCIEPNPIEYGCDFVTNAQQGIEIVKKVDNRGFGLHLDIACMTLSDDDIEKSIFDASDMLKHFHISAPYLDSVNDSTKVKHDIAAKALRAINYKGFVSIEMRPGEIGTNKKRVEEAIFFAQRIYG